MNKEDLLHKIITTLTADLMVLTEAARTAHAAASRKTFTIVAVV